MRTGGSSAEPTHTHTLTHTADSTPPTLIRPHRTHTGSFHLQVDRLLLQQLTRPVARPKVNQLRWHCTTRTPGQQALILVLGEQHQCLRVGVLGKPQSCMACAVMRGGPSLGCTPGHTHHHTHHIHPNTIHSSPLLPPLTVQEREATRPCDDARVNGFIGGA